MADGNEGLNLLYIEDDMDNQTLVNFYVRKSPHSLDIAATGSAALELLVQNSYEVILLDWNMPTEPSGAELLEKIRDIPEYETVPVIIITGFSRPSELKGLDRDQIHTYLTKPLRKRRLLGVLEELENHS